MTAEWVTATATVATLVVIAVSAAFAMIQLRHMRVANQITVLSEIRDKISSAEFKDAVLFIRYELPQRSQDPEFRKRLLDNTTREAQMVAHVANFLDGEAAQLVKHQMVDRKLACDWFYVPVVPCWDALAPLIATRRALLGYRLWEDFEYFTLLCKQFREQFPDGTYPKNVAPLPLPPPWPEATEAAQ